MDKRIRVAGIVGAIIFAVLIWFDVIGTPSATLIPEPTTEYDNECANMEFYKIRNGWMTNCYPENVFLKDDHAIILLKAIKDL